MVSSILVSLGSGREAWISRCDTVTLRFRVEVDGMRAETLSLAQLLAEYPVAAAQFGFIDTHFPTLEEARGSTP